MEVTKEIIVWHENSWTKVYRCFMIGVPKKKEIQYFIDYGLNNYRLLTTEEFNKLMEDTKNKIIGI